MRVIKLDCGDIAFSGEDTFIVDEKHVCLKCAMKNAVNSGLIKSDQGEKDFGVIKEMYHPISVEKYVEDNPWADISKSSVSNYIY